MIVFKKVNKLFNSKKRNVWALKNIDLAFSKTGLTFILGQSGAGKSTLLNILSLQDVPTSGEVLINNKDISKLTQNQLASLRCQYFGIIFQNLNLIEDLTVYENISVGMEIKHIIPSKQEVLEVLKKLNLAEDVLNEKVSNLSGGQKQRIAIARALIKKPQVIICDEPTGSLDDKNSLEIMEILKKISLDTLVIIVTHSKKLSNKYADRIISMADGEIKHDSNPMPTLDDEDSFPKLIRTNLPAKSLTKLTLSTFRRSILKTIFILASFAVSLGLILFTLTIYKYDDDKILDKVILEEDVRYFNYQMSDTVNDSSYTQIFGESLLSLGNLYGNECVFSVSNSIINSAMSANRRGFIREDDNGRAGGVCFSEEVINEFDFKLYGSLPNDDNNPQIALSLFNCYLLGWLEKGELYNEEMIQGIIDNEVFIMSIDNIKIKFDVVGLIDTKYFYINEDSPEAKKINNISHYQMNEKLFFSEQYILKLAEYSEIMRRELYEKENEKVDTSCDYSYDEAYILTKNNNIHKINEIQKDNIIHGFTSQIHFRAENVVSAVTEAINSYRTASLILTLFAVFLTFFYFIGFLSNSIKYNMKSIVVLRSLGIKRGDSSKVFLLQSSIVLISCMLVATIAYCLTTFIVNNYFRKMLYTIVSVIDINVLIIALTFIITLFFVYSITVLLIKLLFCNKRIAFVG